MLFGKYQLNWRSGLAEFFIILVGVALALWADNWREGLEDRSLEQTYLSRLAEDIARDTAAISRMMELAVVRADYAGLVLDAFETRTVTIEPAEFVRAVEHAWFFGYPTYARSTIEDLSSTGNLRLLRDAEMKDAVSAYYALIDGIAQFRDVYVPTQQELGRIMPRILTLEQRFAAFDNLPEDYRSPFRWADPAYSTDAAEAQRVLDRLLEAPEVVPLYGAMVRTQGRHHANLARISGAAKALIELLEGSR